MSIDKNIEHEYAFYLLQSEEWKRDHHGKFALIKDQTIVGIYTSYEDALQQGLGQFGDVPFLIHEIGSENTPQVNTFSLLGMI